MSQQRCLGVSALSHFNVCRSGRHIELCFLDQAGAPASLHVPQECLSALLMTLPAMIEMAIRRRTGNPALRQVYPLGDWQLHEGSEPGSLILSLATPDGFRVSFCADVDQAALLGEALAGQPTPDPAAPPPLRH